LSRAGSRYGYLRGLAHVGEGTLDAKSPESWVVYEQCGADRIEVGRIVAFEQRAFKVARAQFPQIADPILQRVPA
jgi:hypothetical protein